MTRRRRQLQVGALGLGAVVVVLASTTLADVTGILAAGAVSLLGLLVLPAKGQMAKNELRAKVVAMRERLMEALTGQFDHELERSIQRGRLASLTPAANGVFSGDRSSKPVIRQAPSGGGSWTQPHAA